MLLYEIINALDNIIKKEVYRKNNVDLPEMEKVKELDLLLSPFLSHSKSFLLFRDTFIREFYKKFLNVDNITVLGKNYLYYSLVIGLVNLYREQNPSLSHRLFSYFSDDDDNISSKDYNPVRPCRPPVDISKIKTMFIENIFKDVFYVFNFKPISNSQLSTLNDVNYKTYLEKEYPVMNDYLNEIETVKPIDQQTFMVILHFIFITNILKVPNLGEFECITLMKSNGNGSTFVKEFGEEEEEEEEEEKEKEEKATTLDIDKIFKTQTRNNSKKEYTKNTVNPNSRYNNNTRQTIDIREYEDFGSTTSFQRKTENENRDSDKHRHSHGAGRNETITKRNDVNQSYGLLVPNTSRKRSLHPRDTPVSYKIPHIIPDERR